MNFDSENTFDLNEIVDYVETTLPDDGSADDDSLDLA